MWVRVCVSWLNLFSLLYWLLMFLYSNSTVSFTTASIVFIVSSYSRYRAFLSFIFKCLHLCVFVYSPFKISVREIKQKFVYSVSKQLYIIIVFIYFCYAYGKLARNKRKHLIIIITTTTRTNEINDFIDGCFHDSVSVLFLLSLPPSFSVCLIQNFSQV